MLSTCSCHGISYLHGTQKQNIISCRFVNNLPNAATLWGPCPWKDSATVPEELWCLLVMKPFEIIKAVNTVKCCSESGRLVDDLNLCSINILWNA